jgi:hypothetical protein
MGLQLCPLGGKLLGSKSCAKADHNLGVGDVTHSTLFRCSMKGKKARPSLSCHGTSRSRRPFSSGCARKAKKWFDVVLGSSETYRPNLLVILHSLDHDESLLLPSSVRGRCPECANVITTVLCSNVGNDALDIGYPWSLGRLGELYSCLMELFLFCQWARSPMTLRSFRDR